MIFIFTALFAEAKQIIEAYHLEPNRRLPGIPVYESEQVCLAITGTGSIAAAAVVAMTVAQFSVSPRDELINLGICGAAQGEIGELYLCHKIIEESTGRTFYPDRIYKSQEKEGCVMTCARPANSAQAQGCNFLYDMEAAGVYQGGSYFFGPHQMSFLKITSDLMEPAGVTKELVEQLLQNNWSSLQNYIDAAIQRSSRQTEESVMDMELEQWKKDICASVTMEHSLKQLIRYCRLAEINYREAILEGYRLGKLPCNSKREGKKYLEELRTKLL